jgi:hypothetical protein
LVLVMRTFCDFYIVFHDTVHVINQCDVSTGTASQILPSYDLNTARYASWSTKLQKRAINITTPTTRTPQSHATPLTILQDHLCASRTAKSITSTRKPTGPPHQCQSSNHTVPLNRTITPTATGTQRRPDTNHPPKRAAAANAASAFQASS